MGIHQRPVPAFDGLDNKDDVAHLHLHFNPPLLRSATVKKFLVGCVKIHPSYSTSLFTDLLVMS
jgi:UDPglucose--hexose-1-phosphate uridylyltransferase